jgi:hypothetical protein
VPKVIFSSKNKNQDEIYSPSSHAGSGVNEKAHANDGAGGPANGGAPGGI